MNKAAEEAARKAAGDETRRKAETARVAAEWEAVLTGFVFDQV
jgi:hypothetical protein